MPAACAKITLGSSDEVTLHIPFAEDAGRGRSFVHFHFLHLPYPRPTMVRLFAIAILPSVSAQQLAADAFSSTVSLAQDLVERFLVHEPAAAVTQPAAIDGDAEED